MKSSKYKNVYSPNPRKYARKNQWQARCCIKGEVIDQFYPTEKEAAIAVDKFRIKKGLKPVNILKHAPLSEL